jgi:diguanylate cyclase (GGDEF)-like protein
MKPPGIALRFGLLLAFVGVLASGLTGYYAYNASRDLLVSAAETRLLTATQVLSRRITVMLDAAAADVRLLAGHPRAAAILRVPSANGHAAMEDELAVLFERVLAVHPEYFQIRLISADEHGIERVRMDRHETEVLRVGGEDLQEKGHYPYVFDTLTQSPGTVYVSRPVINHERGAHAGQGKPALQIAAPIHADGGSPLGLVVINVDLNSMFTLLAADLPQDFGLYLANRWGDYLVHPDSAKAFAFDQGRRVLVQEQFAATAALIDGEGDQVVTTAAVPHVGGDVVAVFMKQPFKAPQQTTFFILGLSQPLRTVLKESNALGIVALQIVFAFSALSIILAALLARAVTRPLDQMVQAVQHFTADHSRDPLPVARGDEIGVLARSFAEMQQQIAAQLTTLHQNQRELDHLASHDSLTGLPNRRMFDDRLEHALARARRSNEHLALLFIDLDCFKEINDSRGHAAGDTVLRAVATRIRAVVREFDTVARLGGDEFIVLLEATGGAAAVAGIAQKILDALTPAIPHEDGPLRIGASIGISQYPMDATNAAELAARADRAMYKAKSAGRNRFCLVNCADCSGMPARLDECLGHGSRVAAPDRT